MDWKRVTILVTLSTSCVLTSVFAQPPPPPEVPKELLSNLPLDSNVNTGINETVMKCPEQTCEHKFIPQHCIEVKTFDYQGIQCEACPRWRDGCVMKTVVPNNPVVKAPPVACPLLQCDTHVPTECRVDHSFEFRGRTCQGCPKWKEGCQETERLNSQNNPFKPVAQPTVPCPLFPCPAFVIPEECREQQPYDFRGRTCYKCPKWRTGCEPPSVLSLSNAPAIACPLMKCDIPNVPKECLKEETFLQQGRVCHKCPTAIPNCKAVIQPQPIRDVRLINPIDIVPEIACPLVRCRLVFIPDECKEVESFAFMGKTCSGCPRHKTGCVPNMVRPSSSMDDFRQNPGQSPELERLNNLPVVRPERACPTFACAMMLIPPECKEEQPFMFDGKTCYKCPKWREGCVSKQAGVNQPEVSCPLVPCPRIYIPPECRQETPYDFRGKMCYRCPKWKDGCIPGAPGNVESLPAVESTNGVKTGVPEMACPLFQCPRIMIPKECRELVPFEFKGKTCYKCPVWRAGCRPREGSTTDQENINVGPVEHRIPDYACPNLKCDVSKIPTECRQKKTFRFRGKTCQDCPVWRDGCKPDIQQIETGKQTSNENNKVDHPKPIRISTMPQILPVDTLRNMIAKAVCPPLPCPNLNIPVQCRDATTYQYEGVTCEGCPRWSRACMYGAFGSPSNGANINGMMAFNMFNEMFHRRR